MFVYNRFIVIKFFIKLEFKTLGIFLVWQCRIFPNSLLFYFILIGTLMK